MKTIYLITVATTLTFFAHAQNDSTRLDLGGIVLKRASTQAITIKGEDLEKMPFSSLPDAIRAWAYGTYTSDASMIYVVDGNVISDANAYDVHDIAEVVLVQNAAALTSLGRMQYQVVLVTTRRGGKGSGGFTGAAQVFAVHSPNASTDFFHQYYLNAYKNLEKVSFGVSANYMRDVNPLAKGRTYDLGHPFYQDRWRFSGFLTWRPNAKNTIEVHAGYVPQQPGSNNYQVNVGSTDTVSTFYKGNGKQFLPWVRWHGEWLPGLKNDLQVGYGAWLSVSDLGSDDSSTHEMSRAHAELHSDHLYIRDRISYEIRSGGWAIEPSINGSYEHYNTVSTTTYVDMSPGSPGNPGSVSNSVIRSGPFRNNTYIVTPTLDVSYKRLLNVQGGVATNLSHLGSSQYVSTRYLPYATMTLDLLQMMNAGKSASLQLYGSYAQRNMLSARDYYLSDDIAMGTLARYSPGPVFVSGSPIFTSAGSGLSTLWSWQMGIRYTSADKRWEASYHMEQQNGTFWGLTATPGGGISNFSAEWKSTLHNLGVRMTVVDKDVVSWRTGITATIIRNKPAQAPDQTFEVPVGDMSGRYGPSSTWGWTNRVRVRNFSFGADVLCHFDRRVNVQTGTSMTNIAYSIFQLQNIYFGYHLPAGGRKQVEIYVDSKGLVRSDKYGILDSRRYYGVGGKITI